MNRRMQPPVYEVSIEEGLPHERNFVINCLVGSKFRESGCGKSKKLAKRKAASKMLATLKAQPIIVDDADHIGGFGGFGGKSLPIDEDELAQGIAQRNAILKGQKNKGKNEVLLPKSIFALILYPLAYYIILNDANILFFRPRRGILGIKSSPAFKDQQ